MGAEIGIERFLAKGIGVGIGIERVVVVGIELKTIQYLIFGSVAKDVFIIANNIL